ncbi:XRE family transcriptional regulator [Aquincola sp. MAHUQ-54]|uniref:XRE family transcriptional regulator n=1 Tax=Aquincola agrisoli TaxID=3119538 RepID=A0AAW9QC88_9BURK
MKKAPAKKTSTRVEEPSDHLARLSQALRDRRRRAHLSIERLAELSGVSRSMISKVERAEATPSTSVLSKIAVALDITFSDLLAEQEEQEVVLLPARVQPVIQDRESGFTRRCLSPILPGRGIDWVLSTLPSGATTGELSAHRRGTEEYIYVLTGTLEASVGQATHRLEAGDAIFFQAAATHQFFNPGQGDCQYFLVIDSSRLRR